MRRAAAVLLATLACAGAVVAVARADGDPASDYLLSQSTFVPPDDGIPAAYADQLKAVVRDANARGYKIRVALIGSRYDMGSVAVLYEKPKEYARFLGQELKLVYKNRLLIVMPNGLAVSRGGKPTGGEQSVVDRLPPPGKDGAALAAAGTDAVIRLAAGAGVIVPKPPLAATGRTTARSSVTRDRITIAVAALVLLAIAGAIVLARRRRPRRRT